MINSKSRVPELAKQYHPHGLDQSFIDLVGVAGIRSAGRAGLAAGAPGGKTPDQQRWHASSCKNASHGAVIEELLAQGSAVFARSVVMNLDCDQVPLTDFWEELINVTLRDPVGPIACNKGGPMTGRVGSSAMDFVLVGGYDAEADIAGSGFQDLDILTRMKKRSGQQPMYLSRGLGVYAPNSEDKLADRGTAKIRLCDQGMFQTWAQMDAHNRTTMKKKVGTLRNLGAAAVKDWPDMSWASKVETWLAAVKSKWTWRQVPRATAASSSANCKLSAVAPALAPGGAPQVMNVTAKASSSPAPRSIPAPPPPAPPPSMSPPLSPPPPLTPLWANAGTRSKASPETCTRSKAHQAAAASEPKQPPPPPAFTQVQLRPIPVKARPALPLRRQPVVVLRSAARGSTGTAAAAPDAAARTDIRVNIVTAGWLIRASHFSKEQRGTARAWRTSWMVEIIITHAVMVMVGLGRFGIQTQIQTP